MDCLTRRNKLKVHAACAVFSVLWIGCYVAAMSSIVVGCYWLAVIFGVPFCIIFPIGFQVIPSYAGKLCQSQNCQACLEKKSSKQRIGTRILAIVSCLICVAAIVAWAIEIWACVLGIFR